MSLLHESAHNKGYHDAKAGRCFEPPLSGDVDKAYYLSGFNSARGEEYTHQASPKQKAIINHSLGKAKR